MRSKSFRLCVGRRSHSLPVVLLLVLIVVVTTRLWLVEMIRSSLQTQRWNHDLQHLRRSRNLKQYLQNIQLLIEPSSTRCEGAEEVPLLVMVSSPPSHLERRGAIRNTWAKHQPTIFFLGVDGTDRDQVLVDTYIEAKEYGDMVVLDFLDHYDNLTLKTALMLQWSRRRCPTVGALLKTDDDVFLNPWRLKEVLRTHENSPLIGYKLNDSKVHREEHSKWHLPHWLFPRDVIPEYLSGTSYILQGDYIDKILEASYKTPMINLEDVYFTYLVSRSALRLSLSHDRRLSPYKPWITADCAFWGLASVHSVTPMEIMGAWEKIESLAWRIERGEEVCTYMSYFSSDIFLY